MTDGPVNLSRYRKEKARGEAKAQADANVARFGRTKAERLLEATRTDKARAMLDRHKIDDE